MRLSIEMREYLWSKPKCKDLRIKAYGWSVKVVVMESELERMGKVAIKEHNQIQALQKALDHERNNQ